MPIELHYHEQGIYRAEWLDNVAIEEVITEMQNVRKLASQNGDLRFTLIVDLTTVKRIPFDVRNLSKVADSDNRIAAFIILKASTTAQILGNMLNKISGHDFRFVDSLDEALDVSRSLVKQIKET